MWQTFQNSIFLKTEFVSTPKLKGVKLFNVTTTGNRVWQRDRKEKIGKKERTLINFSFQSKYVEHMKIAIEPGQNGHTVFPK